MSLLRLDKFLADANIGTRSEVKSQIKKGLVAVNGETITRPEHKVNTDTDEITYHGESITFASYEYYILNKPSGYVSATKDNTAPTVLSLVESNRKDLFPVGRLDKDTEGLLLITNDGALAHFLLSPNRHVPKTYYAVVDGILEDTDIQCFEKGVPVGDEDLFVALPAKLHIRRIDETLGQSHAEVTIWEGKFHQVKRMFQAVGKKVLYLQRISFGSLVLPKDLPLGTSRPLTSEEYSCIMRDAQKQD